MKSGFIVILCHPNGPILMRSGDGHETLGEVFPTREEAQKAGRENMIGRAYGYVVYAYPDGGE